MAGSKLFLPNRRHEPLPNYRDAELLRSATGSKSINSLPRWERPPGLPRAAFLPRRLAILRGVRRVGAGGREFWSL